VASLGGSIAAFEQGFIQNTIAQNTIIVRKLQLLVNVVMVGVNKFRFDEKPFVYKAKETPSSTIPLLKAQRLSEVVEAL
jgi:methylmalonyl-CoA mutase